MNLSLFRKEYRESLSAPSVGLVLAAFGIISAVVHWWFEGENNLLNAGFADLTPYFDFTPWLLAVFVSALGMKSIAEEKRTGTLALLLAQPQKPLFLIINKLLSVWLLSLLMLLPTFSYLPFIYHLSINPHDFDVQQVLTAYLGLCLLALVFAAFSVLASSFSRNQLAAYFLGLGLSLLFYQGWQSLAAIFPSPVLESLFSALSFQNAAATFTKGVLDTRYLAYWLALVVWAVYLATLRISPNRPGKRVFLKNQGYFVLFWVLALLVSQYFYQRIDTTRNNKFTLSPATLTLLDNIDKPVAIDVFLSGKLPGEYAKLERETRDLLDEMKARNGLLSYQFIDPLEDQDMADQVVDQLLRFGLQPVRVSSRKKGQITEQVVFPWAVASVDNETVVNIPLLTEKNHPDKAVKIARSVEELEYHFFVKINVLFKKSFKKMAVIKGNGEAPDRLLADGLASLRDFYDLAPFTLDSVAASPTRTLKQLQLFDLIWIAGPTEAFSEEEKLVLDQYLLSGGNILLNVDKALVATDSLFNNGQALALPADLQLDDMLFKYGLRINPVLVQDKYTSPLMLVSGSGANQQYNVLPWLYAPMILPNDSVTVNKGVENVRVEFANAIDTLPNAVKKTLLWQTSPISRVVGLPTLINLNETVAAFENFEGNGTRYTLGVLLEGAFTSAYKNRVLPFPLKEFQPEGQTAKMVVFSDSQIFNSQTDRGTPLPLGYDKWTGNRYGNKDVLLNAANYLGDDANLIELRSKKFVTGYLDLKKLETDSVFYQGLALLMPLLLLVPLFVVTLLWRKRFFY